MTEAGLMAKPVGEKSPVTNDALECSCPTQINLTLTALLFEKGSTPSHLHKRLSTTVRYRSVFLLFLLRRISAVIVQPRNNNINPTAASRVRVGRQNESIRRYMCPVGFFRLKRYCYYLSGGTAPWREAYFHCRDRNATLAILDRNGKDRMLRKYLSSDQFKISAERLKRLHIPAKLERWIGGIYNWQQMAWEWGVTGEKVVFQNFGLPQSNNSKQQYAWHCITIDPALRYKWSPRSCVERKHYVCEVPAGRIARRRKKTTDPYAPQNQRLKPRKKGKKYSKEPRKLNKKNRQRGEWRRRYTEQYTDNWAHGVNLGSRPPNVRELYSRTRMRHHPNRTQPNHPQVAQVLPRDREYDAFPADSPSNGPQSLTAIGKTISQIPDKINNLASEEVLLKL
ncbi:hypothetical protein WN51_12074 [Melipona quadrifasciata]|uniref:C-type lectin domain-containing protein n=1 Tax=Melipona quadrifasciata TaxID=166423 RepID=A0A0M9A2B3_9HYME|nr:hypothetical protein WN51_12074 [Melipona quadrifasciata]